VFSRLADFDSQYIKDVRLLPGRTVNGGTQLTLFKGAASGVIGVDEVGRGCLAGPVMAAAVMLPVIESVSWLGELLEKLNDSKQLTARRREKLAETIRACSWFAVGSASPEEIDQINILQASHLAMRRAVEGLAGQLPMDFQAATVLVDGIYPIAGLKAKQVAVPNGDEKSAAIAAASVVAKVARDDLMLRLDQEFGQFGWSKNKGYPSQDHCDAIALHGRTSWHRRSFYVRTDRQLKLTLEA
jgi:ribonuclease HII